MKEKCEVLYLNGLPCFISNKMIWFQLKVQSRYQMQLKISKCFRPYLDLKAQA